MSMSLLDQPGQLFLGSTASNARAQGGRHFGTARKAIRFALEHAAPVSLRGAQLCVGDRLFGPSDIRALHRELVLGDRTRRARDPLV